MISQKKYFITIKRFDKNLHLDIKQNFCEVTKSLCRGSESRSSTYDAPCRLRLRLGSHIALLKWARDLMTNFNKRVALLITSIINLIKKGLKG